MANLHDISKTLKPLIYKGLLTLLFFKPFIPSASADLVNFENMGTTYDEHNKTGGPWAPLGYGANGNLGFSMAASGTLDTARRVQPLMLSLSPAPHYNRNFMEPVGQAQRRIESYQHAVSFSFLTHRFSRCLQPNLRPERIRGTGR